MHNMDEDGHRTEGGVMKDKRIQGEIQNLKPHITRELQSLYDLSVARPLR